MTKKLLMHYTSALVLASVLVGVSFANASEVTGTLSSDASASTLTSGDISGTVSGGSRGGGGSSSGGSRNSGGSFDSSPPGSVLGASTDSATAPSFPNAGFAPEERTSFSLVGNVSMIFISIITFITSR